MRVCGFDQHKKARKATSRLLWLNDLTGYDDLLGQIDDDIDTWCDALD